VRPHSPSNSVVHVCQFAGHATTLPGAMQPRGGDTVDGLAMSFQYKSVARSARPLKCVLYGDALVTTYVARSETSWTMYAVPQRDSVLFVVCVEHATRFQAPFISVYLSTH